MTRRGLSYEQAVAKHPGCRIELIYMAVDETYPDYQSVPTATAPAIVVWPGQTAGTRAEPLEPIAVYWLRGDD
jgi:hypothetical protein